MALPKLNAPVFELILPSSGETIKYRPFLVKEEKLLLIAQQSNEQRDIFNSVIQVVQNCMIDNIDVQSLPLVDLEYIFINLRSKSVSNISEVNIKDQEDGENYKVIINLDELNVIKPEKEIDPKIDLGNNIGVIMTPPTVSSISKYNFGNTQSADAIYDIVISCIKSIYDDNQVYETSEHTKEELDEFITSLSSNQFNLIKDYFDSMPKIQTKIKYQTKSGKDKEMVLEGLNDFFS